VIYCTYSGAGEALKKTKQKIISLLNFNIYGLEPIWAAKKACLVTPKRGRQAIGIE
jgi:hypothetical protein